MRPSSAVDLGEVGGLPDAVHPTEGDDERLALGTSIQHVPQDVHAALGLQDLHQRILQRLLYRRGHSWRRTKRFRIKVMIYKNKEDVWYSLVKVPMTLPSSFLATESQSWEAISAATFLA